MKNSIIYCGDIHEIIDILVLPDRLEAMEHSCHWIYSLDELARDYRPADVYIQGWDEEREDWLSEYHRWDGKELS